MARNGRFGSSDKKGLREILKRGVILRGGEGTIDLGDRDDVHIAVLFDVEGYGPHNGAIYVDQNRYHASSDTALQAGYEILEDYVLESTDDAHIKDLQDEWGDEWQSVLNETIDGQTWVLSAKDAAWAISDTDAEKYIDVEEAEDDEHNELDGAKSPLDAMAWSSDMLVRDVASEVDDRDLNEIAESIMEIYLGTDEDYEGEDEDDWDDPARSFEAPKATKNLSKKEAVEASTLASQIVDWANYATSYGDYDNPPWER